MYGYRARGLLSTLLYKMREWYREHVGDQQFKLRPIWTYYELEFIQMELLPFLAKHTKQTFKAPKEVVQRLDTAEIDLDDRWNDDGSKKKTGKKKWYQFSKSSKKKVKTAKFAKHPSVNSLTEDDEKVSDEEKVPIEVFAEFLNIGRNYGKR